MPDQDNIFAKLVALSEALHQKPLFGTAGLLRVSAGAVVGLVLISAVLSKAWPGRQVSKFAPQAAGGSQIQTLDRGAPLAFLDRGEANAPVAWIAGSTLNVKPADEELPPYLLTNEIGSMAGAVIDPYVLEAGGIHETYVSVLDALDKGYPLVVVAINPLTCFNTRFFKRWENTAPQSLRRVRSAGDLAHWAMLSRPSDAATALVASGSNLLQHTELSRYSRLLQQIGLKTIPKSKKGAFDDRMRELRMVERKTVRQKWLDFDQESVDRAGSKWQVYQDPAANSFNVTFLRRMAELAEGGRILFYFPPVSPEFTAASTARAEQISNAESEARRLLLDSGCRSEQIFGGFPEVVPAGQFVDPVHTNDHSGIAGPLAAWLAEHIES